MLAPATAAAAAGRARPAYPLMLLVQADAYHRLGADAAGRSAARSGRCGCGACASAKMSASRDFRLRVVLEGRPRDAAGQLLHGDRGGAPRNDGRCA